MQNTAQNEVVHFDHAVRGDGAGGLAAVMRRLSSARSLEEIMATVTYGVRSLLHADGATFVLRDGDRCFYAEEDAISPLWKGKRFPMSICISGWCMMHGAPAVIHDVYADPRIPAGAYRPTFVRSMAMAPVGVEEPVAALGAYWSATREITAEEVQGLQTIANAAALAVAYVQALDAAPPPRPAPRRGEPERQTRSDHRPWLVRLMDSLRHDRLGPNTPGAYGFALLSVILAGLARWGIEAAGVNGLVPFATFFPATLLTVLVAGSEAGALAGLLGGLIGFWAFMAPPGVAPKLTPVAVLDVVLYLGSTGLMIWMLDHYRRAVRRFMQEDARLVTLAREQQHRMQNALSVVETIVRQSLREDTLLARTITQRIRAGLAGVDIRPRGNAGGAAALRALLSRQLQPFDLSRFRFEGVDETPLAPDVCNLFALAVHELAVNALKYGALSTPNGQVAVDWLVADGCARLSWRETGGPAVLPTTARGYGSILLNRLVAAAKGSFRRDFAPAGVAAELSIPLARQAA